MMATVISKEEAYAHLAAVVDRAWAGEEIVIEQSGAPKLRLVPVETPPAATPRRVPGSMKGLIKEMPGVWDPLSEEELKEMGL